MNVKKSIKSNRKKEVQVKCRFVQYLFLFTVVAGIISSCQNRPGEVLNRKQMERLMYDVYVAEATMENDYQNFDTPEKKEAYIRRVFKAHKTTQDQWDTSLSWYSDRIDIYLKMNDSVKARIQRDRQKVDAEVARQYALQNTDPAYLSPSFIPSFYQFSKTDMGRGFRFKLDSVEIFSKITEDHFSFTFSVTGIPPVFTSPFASLIIMDYRDTTIYLSQQIKENIMYNFPVNKYIDGDTLSQIAGFVHLQDSTSINRNIQLYNISLGNMQKKLAVADSTVDIPVHVNRELIKMDSDKKIEKP
ncbi:MULTISPECIES: DUF4296 domain-containing protein [Proteiniphilum]|jgi:hypothetical protein|uniref:DUF4296 domain-containing protein n=1 Tax=Proteiniphilum TaxID=294702 RepID=UPI001EECD666|nr:MULTISPECIES: DUF4296 domain-containing protein [Proteiniphilum]ULB35685.1 DUF4296 domain-containing protein [Proteiniphilum propionicum]